MAPNFNGIIYYKLDAASKGYPGDITKNCGLRGEEIDGNFNFLRGEDIKSIYFDTDNTLYLERFDGEVLSAKPNNEEYDFSYNQETGILTIITPNGKEIKIEGLNTRSQVYHDFTLEGTGLGTNPLTLANISKTGRFAPAIKLIDTTSVDDSGMIGALPTSNINKHDRYVTKERISRFGCLYPLSGVLKINEQLRKNNSEWRVPSKADWDALLNAIDCAKPNHDSPETNVLLGEFAGAALKASQYWLPSKSGDVLSDNKFGFSIYPLGYAGNRGINYYGSFGETAAFWTATEEDKYKEMYVKTFDYRNEAVGQYTWGENYYLSLRLVKTLKADNYNDAEVINGVTYNCVHVPNTNLVWTKENVGFTQVIYEGFVPKEWEAYENLDNEDNSYETRYFINDWNGEDWDKHEMFEGEGIVLRESENGKLHEWILVNGELVDSVVHIKDEFKNTLNEIYSDIEQEATERLNADVQLQTNIDIESEARKQHDNIITSNLEAEIRTRVENDEALQANIDNEVIARKEADASLLKEVEAFISSYDTDYGNLLVQLNETKIVAEDTSLVVKPGSTNEDGLTIPTSIKLNVPTEGMIKADEFGVYFDGNFGTF
jgi:uncharacterized protein (TIGR02145 family)